MSFFKRLSRSRSNSQSYVDSYHSPHDSKTNSASYDDRNYPVEKQQQQQQQQQQHQRADSGRMSDHAPQLADPLASQDSPQMYARSTQPTDAPSSGGVYASPPMSAGGGGGGGGGGAGRGMSNGYGGASYSDNQSPNMPAKHEPTPDLLMQAFNQALRPYTDKVDSLENEIADLRAYIDQLEMQRSEVHSWIDKRGLRPDVPHNIAVQMDNSTHASSPTHAAATLNAQLDRKITIVNFDLHRLQDDLNDSLPTPSFSACMLKFLPDIERLANLPSGPRYAFDLLLKLGGNLNSHGGLENGDEADLAERRSFYARLDDAMVGVVQGRFKEEGEEGWGVLREIKRIEKTGAYLRNWGVEPYFPRTLEEMRAGVGQSAGGAAEGSPPNY